MERQPDFNHVAPNSCMLNIVLSLDTKGVSHIYKMIVGNNRSIVKKACDKWNEKLTTKIETFSVRKSSSRISMFDDTCIYLRYIQFKTLH